MVERKVADLRLKFAVYKFEQKIIFFDLKIVKYCFNKVKFFQKE